MNVSTVQNFIDDLKKLTLEPYDQEYQTALEDEFSKRISDEPLGADDLFLLETIFKKREKQVLGSSNDYMIHRNMTAINVLWTELARQVAITSKKTILEILFPSAKNKNDPNSFTPLVLAGGEDSFIPLLYYGPNADLYALDSLLEHVRKKNILCTYNPYSVSSDLKPRCLSLSELLQIRAKQRGEDFVLDCEVYKNYWDYFQRKIFPHCEKNGCVPKQLAPILLEMVELYFSDGFSYKKLKELLTLFSSEAMECSIDDINCFYAQSIEVNGERKYLVDILLDFLEFNSSSLEMAMIAVARWICLKIDASFIARVSEDNRHKIYSDLNVGPFFSYKQLKELLHDISKSQEITVNVRDHLSFLLKEMDAVQEISSMMVLYLKQLFEIHIRDGANFTKKLRPIDQLLVNLAQHLSGKGIFEPNYYQYLIVAKEHQDRDAVQDVPPTHYPLNCYIEPVTGPPILLINSLRYFRQHDFFVNCNVNPPRPFFEAEIKQIQNGPFSSFINRKRDTDVRLAMCKSTWDAIKSFVDDAFVPRTLICPNQYTAQEQKTADAAFLKLQNYIWSLPPDEKRRLFHQRIFLNSDVQSVFEIFQRMEGGGNVCASWMAQFFMKLVINYDRDVQFVLPEVNKRADKMRDTSSGIRYRDEQPAQRDFSAKDKLRMISVYLLQRTGPCKDLSEAMRQMSPVSAEVFKKIVPMIVSGDWTNAESVLKQIRTYDIENAFAPVNSWKAWMRGWTDEIRRSMVWLRSINDGTFFKQSIPLFELPSLLHRAIEMYTEDPGNYRKLAPTLDYLLIICARPGNKESKGLLINGRIELLFQTLAAEEKDRLLTRLNSSGVNCDLAATHSLTKAYAAFLIHRLSMLAGTQKSSLSIYPKIQYNHIHTILEKTLHSSSERCYSTIPEVIDRLVQKVTTFTDLVCEGSSKLSMLSLLNCLNPTNEPCPTVMTRLSI